MTNRGKYIQEKVLEAIYDELAKQNLKKDDCLEYLKSHTLIKESRIKSILNGTNKRTITIDEVNYIAFSFNVHVAYLFRKVDRNVLNSVLSNNRRINAKNINGKEMNSYE